MSTRILLVEDNIFDVKIFWRALREANFKNAITVVGHSIDALAILHYCIRNDKFDLIVVTNLNMPRVNGIELLRTIRGDKAFVHLPVFVVTTSDAPSDREKALELRVEGYIYKTGEGRDLIAPILTYLARQERYKP